MFVASITGGDPIEIVKNKSHLSADFIKEKIVTLIKNGLVEDDEKTLTDIGRSSLKVILAGGVFDIIHPGHIYTLNSAKALGNVLVVVVATNDTAQKMKKRVPLHSEEQRKDLVNSLSMVDLCVIGQEGDIFKTVENIHPDIIALGYDQVHQEKFITKGYTKQFQRNIGYIPFPGTLNVKLNTKEHAEAVRQLDALDGIFIKGFSDGKRTYGWLKCFKAKLNKTIDCQLIRLERTHHNISIIEVIAKKEIRKGAKLSNGSKITVRIDIDSKKI